MQNRASESKTTTQEMTWLEVMYLASFFHSHQFLFEYVQCLHRISMLSAKPKTVTVVKFRQQGIKVLPECVQFLKQIKQITV